MFLTLLATTLVLMSLVFHEMGHWALLTRYRVSLTEYGLGLGPLVLSLGKLKIRLFLIGGYVLPNFQEFNNLTGYQKAMAALGGPLFSTLYGLLLYYVGMHLETKDASALILLANLNFVLAFLNLLPIPPLDGWNILIPILEERGVQIGHDLKCLGSRLGNGLIYGLGFFVLFRLFVPGS